MKLNEFAIRKMLLITQRYLLGNPLLERVENRMLSRMDFEKKEIPPPIFIIGAPRTGSTLLYQLLVCNYSFSYFSNFSAFFYKSPLWATEISSSLFRRYNPSKYESSYGLIPGIWSPSEAGQIYRYWLSTDDEFKSKKNRIKRTLQGISYIQNGPFIWKNLDLSMRIAELREIFPNAVFIHSKRNPIFTAQSLLIARKKRYGTYDKWFGIKSPNYKEVLERDPFEQVVLQIKSIEDCIRANVKRDRYIEIEYEKLCKDPHATIKAIAEFLHEKGVVSKEVNKKYMDARISNKIRLENGEYKKLTYYINKYYGDARYE